MDSQRKSPKQGRSKALVDAIYEATVRVLPKVGSRGITTKQIADVAGVSIGSLYQYFPNKDAVLGAVMDLTMNMSLNTLSNKISELDGVDLEENINQLIDLVLAVCLTDRNQHREIYTKAMELDRIPKLLEHRRVVVQRIGEIMKRHRPGLSAKDYEQTAFIATNSVMGVVQTMIFDSKLDYSIEVLSSELKCLLKHYLNERLKRS